MFAVVLWTLANYGHVLNPVFRSGKVVWDLVLDGRTQQVFSVWARGDKGPSGGKVFGRGLSTIDLDKVPDKGGYVQDKHQALARLASASLVLAWQTRLFDSLGKTWCDGQGKPKLTVPIGAMPKAVNLDGLSDNSKTALFLVGLLNTDKRSFTVPMGTDLVQAIAPNTPKPTAKVTRASRRANK